MKFRSLAQRKSAGFGLVEIMVALVIGMVATVVMLQIFSDSESRNRTAAGSGDAQSNGVITFYQLQSNIQRAGYGVFAMGVFGCPTSWQVKGGATIGITVPLAPVSINPTTGGNPVIPLGDPNTDTLLVFYGNSDGEPAGNIISSASGNTYGVQMPTAFSRGDRVLTYQDTDPTFNCGATSAVIDRVQTVDPAHSKITVANSVSPGVATALASNGVQLPGILNLGRGPDGINDTPTSANPTNGPTILAYRVVGGSLRVCDFSTYDCSINGQKDSYTYWVPVASGIVSMRAVYWKDTSAAWDGSTHANDQTQPTDACGWAKVRGINLVLVSRSDERDKNQVTFTTVDGVAAASANAPTWSQNGTAPLVGATGNLAPDTVDAEWKHYRYKTLESVIPIRNVNWMVKPGASVPGVSLRGAAFACTPSP